MVGVSVVAYPSALAFFASLLLLLWWQKIRAKQLTGIRSMTVWCRADGAFVRTLHAQKFIGTATFPRTDGDLCVVSWYRDDVAGGENGKPMLCSCTDGGDHSSSSEITDWRFYVFVVGKILRWSKGFASRRI